MGTCGNCIHKKTVVTDYPCAVCDCVTYYEEPKPKQTQEERIKLMDTNQLAELLYETETQYLPIGLHVENGWLAWLKQEVEE